MESSCIMRKAQFSIYYSIALIRSLKNIQRIKVIDFYSLIIISITILRDKSSLLSIIKDFLMSGKSAIDIRLCHYYLESTIRILSKAYV